MMKQFLGGVNHSGLLMCPNCLNVYTAKYLNYSVYIEEDGAIQGIYTCPNVECSEDLFEIDEMMIVPIRILMQKNYRITNCCSGHAHLNIDMLNDRNIINHIDLKKDPEAWKSYYLSTPYIMFKEVSAALIKPPKGWYWDMEWKKNREDYLSEVMRSKTNITPIDHEPIENLYKWAVDLPEYQEPVMIKYDIPYYAKNTNDTGCCDDGGV